MSSADDGCGWGCDGRELAKSCLGRSEELVECQEQLVDSTGQRNTFAEHLSGRVEAERLTRPLVQLSRDRVELEL